MRQQARESRATQQAPNARTRLHCLFSGLPPRAPDAQTRRCENQTQPLSMMAEAEISVMIVPGTKCT